MWTCGFRSRQAPLFQEHEGHAAELLPVVAADDGMLVGLGDGDGIAHTVKGGEKVGHSGGGIVYHRRDEKN